MQSVRADPDQPGFAAQGAALSLGVPGPVWADLETPPHTPEPPHLQEKGVTRTMPGRLPCSHSFL